MAEPIRIYTPHRDEREELRRKVESAPIDHAGALLAAYELLQEAQDHGVLDTLRGAIGAGEAMIGKASEYANTPEGIRMMRNLLAMARLLGELDPALVDAAVKAISESERKDAASPSLWHALRRLAGADSRRTLATLANVSQAFGKALDAGSAQGQSASSSRFLRSGISAPVVAVGIVAAFAGFWVGRHSNWRDSGGQET
jgi:uncharacterized protein YjgD (DUF1641 family)